MAVEVDVFQIDKQPPAPYSGNETTLGLSQPALQLEIEPA